MKKLLFTLAVAAIAGQASAQALEESKTWDNWYIGVNAGENFKTTHTSVFSNLNPSAGLRVGRYFTPVFGFAVEGEVYFNNKGSQFRPLGTFVKGLNVSLLGTTNLTNWIAGYKGSPRAFEVSAIYGLGYAHCFGISANKDELCNTVGGGYFTNNMLTSKLGLDFAFNFGSEKEWQFYVEPNITYGLNPQQGKSNDAKFNINNSAVGLLVGLNYKFGNSNGTHNFKIADLRNQSEIDALNSKINELRAAGEQKDRTIGQNNKTIADLQAQLNAEKNKKPVVVNENTNVLQPTVIFQQGKSTIDQAQYASVAMVANYMKNHKDAKILIKGYASPEGSAELNQKLSEARATSVKNALVKRYGISASRLSTKGMGATDKLFDEVDFNRVATFTDTTK